MSGMSPSDRLLQDVGMENKKISYGERPGMIIEGSVVKIVYVDAECPSTGENLSFPTGMAG